MPRSAKMAASVPGSSTAVAAKPAAVAETVLPSSADRDRVSLTEEAYRVLKREILDNRLPPGFQALEPELARLLGMSRTPVREALIRLQDEGLVEVQRRRGMRVLPVAPADMREIYQILSVLEGEACVLLAARKPRPNIRALIRETDAMEAAAAAGDRESWAKADDRFHRALVALCGNRRLASFSNMLLDQAHRTVMVTLYIRQLPTKSVVDHRLVLEDIAAGHSEAARLHLRQHREWGAGELLRILERHRLHHL